ncbi:hypothetical protein FOA43_000717 [Brettanomyces nanus]|uniref:HTH APSES-type domain-containing protein n=1 Tax=Eeniella nana TaxID=13502 RepID=A0A875RTE5_EENNA|nr:uncharacterized protein FOA43_000717 [Brettanomyces nanus]QPG73407.1 hypothetical protein FOA43_000717 [Brettanomyces nanus]
MDDLYITTYSQVDVYESTFKGMPLMRRCDDNWVNATQILKIAGYGKAQRTRLLEKQVHQHIHRKIQGGFGRFQGTWVPLEFARDLAEDHKLPKDHVKVLYYDPDSDEVLSKKASSKPRPNSKSKSKSNANPRSNPNPKQKPKTTIKMNPIYNDNVSKKRIKHPVAESADHQTLKKPKKRGRKPKKKVSEEDGNPEYSRENGPAESDPTVVTSTGSSLPPTFAMYGPGNGKAVKHSYSVDQNHPTVALQQMEVVRDTVPLSSDPQQVPLSLNASRSQQQVNQFTFVNANGKSNQQSVYQPQPPPSPPSYSTHSQYQLPYIQGQQTYTQQQNGSIIGYNQFPENDGHYINNDLGASVSSEGMSLKSQGSLPHQQQRQSLIQLQQTYFMGPQQLLTPQSQPQMLQQAEINGDVEEDYDYYTERLLNFFSNDSEPIPEFLFNSPEDFDVNRPIDNEGHTPLHWASALALPSIVELLLSKNANPLILNNVGMNSLSKLIHFTNSYDTKNFSGLLHLLRQCLIVPDAEGRTPLHYLVDLTSESSKIDCLKYYLNEIVTFIGNQQKEAERVAGEEAPHKDLLRILINHRDNDGDTALHLALKNNSFYFAKALIQHGADIDSVGISNIPYELFKEVGMVAEPTSHDHENNQHVEVANHDDVNDITISESTVTRDQTLLLQDTTTQSGFYQKDSPITRTLDTNENKENMLNDSVVTKDLKPNSISISTVFDAVSNANDNSSPITSTPSKSKNVHSKSTNPDSINAFERNFPIMLSKLAESINDEMGNKTEEIKHNSKTIGNLDKEIELLNNKCSKLLKGNFSPFEEAKFNTLLNSAHYDKLCSLLNEKVAGFKKAVIFKRERLFNDFERSQALEVAKFVNEEETKISSDEVPSIESPEETINLAVELALLQIERKKLVNNKVESIAGGTGIELWNDLSKGQNVGSVTVFNEEIKMQAKMYLYKKLISNICDLPMDEINKDLLDGIEMRLEEGQISA